MVTRKSDTDAGAMKVEFGVWRITVSIPGANVTNCLTCDREGEAYNKRLCGDIESK